MSDDFNEDQLLHEGDEEPGVDGDGEGDGVGAGASSEGNGHTADGVEGGDGDDPELEAIKARVRQMEEEALKLKQMQSEVDMTSPVGGGGGMQTGAPATPTLSEKEKEEVDARSVYVGNVDYGATAEELEQHFHGCGAINRVTILCNKFDGHPKGFAYVEFSDKDAVATAMALDDSLFRGRQIKVSPKRTNKPGMCITNRFPRGRGFRGRGRAMGRGFGAIRRGRFRGRGSYYSPY